MNIEVEVKAKVRNPVEMKKHLKKIGAKQIKKFIILTLIICYNFLTANS